MTLGLGLIGWIVIGGLAGWIASKIMKRDESMGVLLNIGAGIAGGLIGGFILYKLGFDVAGGGKIFSFFTALGGACLLLWIIGMIKKPKS
ncbi:MAG: GlsB/YeaQ/YmgE family stress response membrane protein [Gordonia sp. (in: high G+C Gram-positive bacteria)]|uniref:GlsB/YeaQ/YmgE family stress response membrane protein n=1 Tax=Gordonia sp. (in: high G+C Gram-positive bacteria) TaxID=84139 RepID=UPI0039E58E54